jgi:hypothetical protein
MPGKYLRGAFIEFKSSFLVPIPNVIVFQYNPETLAHTWSPAAAPPPSGASQGPGQDNPLAVSGEPGEEFAFTLMMDAGDIIADGVAPAAALAAVSGLYPALAALELLLFPSGSKGGGGGAGALSTGVGAAAGALSGGARGIQTSVPSSVVPTVLFVWGPGRILPVHITSLKVTETLYDPLLLVPTHAEAEISLQVLTQQEINSLDNGLAKQLVQAAHDWMSTERQALAAANSVNSASSIIGMLPF